jgi:very-short-patch-repair endonuclease
MIKCLECGKELLTLKHTHFKWKCTGNIKSLAEYTSKYPGAQTTDESIKKQMAHSESSFIGRYGEIEGKSRWREYCQKLSDKGTLDGFIRSGKTEEEWREFNASRAITLKNLIKRYGLQDGTLRFEHYCKLQRKVGKTLDWYIETYGEADGTARYLEVNSRKGITLPNMIKKYGESEGQIRYDAWHEATQSRYVSKLQTEIIKAIIELLPTNYMFHEGIFGKEFCAYQSRPYMYDFVVTDPIKICIEINGDFYHANPEIYQATDLIKIRGSNGGVLASTIWKNDQQKRAVIESKGYTVYYIWEREWNADKVSCLEKVKRWLQLENA